MRQSAYHKRDDFLLVTHVEPLEVRQLLAGHVLSEVSGTLLKITADSAANEYLISRSGNAVQVTGLSGTQVTLEGDLSRVRRISIDDPGGNDVLTVEDLDGISSLIFKGTGGEKQIAIEQSAIDQLQLSFADGTSLQLDITDSVVERRVMVSVSHGSLATRLQGNTRAGLMTIAVVEGDNDLQMSETSSIDRVLRQTTRGGGNSSTQLLHESRVGRLLSVRNVEGRSDVRIVDEATIDRFVGSGYTRQNNVTYVNRDGESLRADIYMPRSEGPHPAVIVVHGGFWRLGNKAWMSGEARELAQRGYVVMSINYRLAPQDHFPAQIHDMKAAIRWLKLNADQYDIDPNRIGVWGYSAGAQLALLAGLTSAADGLEDPDFPGGGPDTSVQAVVAAAPPSDFRDIDPHSQEFAYLFGGTLAELPDLYAQASPANFVSSMDAPVYMYIGENDQVVSQMKAQQLADDLNAVGVQAELHVVPGKNHLTARRDRVAVNQSLRFLDQQLK